jgi:hypothetical protein
MPRAPRVSNVGPRLIPDAEIARKLNNQSPKPHDCAPVPLTSFKRHQLCNRGRVIVPLSFMYAF